jgi:hypothetical protein
MDIVDIIFFIIIIPALLVLAIPGIAILKVLNLGFKKLSWKHVFFPFWYVLALAILFGAFALISSLF